MPPDTTLAQRVRYAMAKAGFDPDKDKGRAFARKCGLKSDVHVNKFLSGERDGMEEKTARAIGRVADVSWYWLQTGLVAREPYEGDGAGPVAERRVEIDASKDEQGKVELIAMLETKERENRLDDDGREALAALRIKKPKKSKNPSEPAWDIARWRKEYLVLVREARELRLGLGQRGDEPTADEEEAFGAAETGVEREPQLPKPGAVSKRRDR